MEALKDLDAVALIAEVEAKEELTGEPMILRSGQVGTIVAVHNGQYLVEFSDLQNETLVMKSFSASQLPPLHRVLEPKIAEPQSQD